VYNTLPSLDLDPDYLEYFQSLAIQVLEHVAPELELTEFELEFLTQIPSREALEMALTALDSDLWFLDPEVSGLFPEVSGLFPEGSGLFPEVSGILPEVSGLAPGLPGLVPDGLPPAPFEVEGGLPPSPLGRAEVGLGEQGTENGAGGLRPGTQIASLDTARPPIKKTKQNKK
jgi:hypothetical protein